jgi:acyl-CoA synthetase (AMP-forming)/AMP-acid ligase II/thioesterase domain-containing protein/acyl carrier protein
MNKSTRIALVCSNGPEAAAGFLGLAAHVACAPLNPAYRASEFQFYLSDLGPQAVVVEAGLDSAVRPVAAALGIPVWELRGRSSHLAGDIEFAESSNTEDSSPEAGLSPEPQDAALLLHTSGTTARPKLVPLTQENLIKSAWHIADSLGLTAADRCLNVMPLFHIHGLEAALLASLASGASVVCCPGFVGPQFFQWIEDFRPTWYTAVPTIHQLVLARAKSGREFPGSTPLRFIRSCSSALAPSLMEEMEAVFQVPVIEANGMTEASHQVASNPLPPGRRKTGSVGVAAGPEVSIMDAAGEQLPRGAVGEVVIRGPNVTSGYWGNPEANAAAFTDGWFRTGDEGSIDADGYLLLRSRLKEIINRGGEKIAPREVDEALLAHPAIAQAAAFSAPHSLLGETVAAAVVLKPGESESEITEKALREFAGQRLAEFKIPERIVFLDEIPKGATGKIQRAGLAARLGITELGPLETRHSAAVRPRFVAPRSKTEKQIAAVFAATLGVERVGMRDNIFDLGGDSLLTAVLLARIEELHAVKILSLEFAEDPTVAGVCRILDAPRARPSPSGRSENGGLRVVISSGQSSSALFCVPGSSGGVAGFYHLARRLGREQAVTAFRLPAPDSGMYSLEELAARYVAEILAVQPEGPYHLAGVCTGGFVVYEVARQIAAKGKEVGLLALLDCYNHAWASGLGVLARSGYRLDLIRRRLLYQQRNLRRAGRMGAARYLRSKLAALLDTTRLRWAEHRPIRHAAAQYVPREWPGRLDLIRVEEPHVDGFDYPDMGWHGLARGGITIHDVPGNHLTMLSEPNVRFVAERLRAALKQADHSTRTSDSTTHG